MSVHRAGEIPPRSWHESGRPGGTSYVKVKKVAGNDSARTSEATPLREERPSVADSVANERERSN
jgi:hypothetical protein